MPTVDPALWAMTDAERTAVAEVTSSDQDGSVGSVLGPEPTATTAAPPPVIGELHVFATGDPVMLGAATELRKQIPGISIDASVGRQVADGLNVLRARASAGALGNVVVIHLGNNGYFSAKQFDDIMKVLGSARRVVFVNDKVPRRWESSNDDILAAGVARYDNAVLLNWRSYTANSPSLFAKDGFHLQPAGVRLYAQLIAAEVHR